MKNHSKHIDDQIILKVLDGNASASELEEFNSWLSASSKNRELFEKLKLTDDLLQQKKTRILKQKNWDGILEKVRQNTTIPDYIVLPDDKPEPKQRISLFTLRAAAILILLLGLGWLLKSVIVSKNTILSAPDDKVAEYTLPDGSTVYLNKGSYIEYNSTYNKKLRHVNLKGEAFFIVQKNVAIPFIAKTGLTEIRVLGTSFNVYSNPEANQVRVNVASGRVEFGGHKKNSKNIILGAGEEGIYESRNNTFVKNQTSDQNFLAWKTGVLTYNQSRVSAIAADLEHCFNKKIVFEDIDPDTLYLTTIFKDQSVKEIIEEVEILLTLKTRTSNDTIFFHEHD